ncbi:MAG: 3-hydroxyacyl-CoA dehydrogenase protein [Chitinophagaceae bacterium]|nr:3-hydroxyacyl-CoA dehydrogenase protein [Chitinophagaceae bacterium]
MHIIVLADDVIKQEFQNKQLHADIKVTFIKSLSDLSNYSPADAFFLLKEDINKEDNKVFEGKPVFINSTINTLKELGLPENFSRINGWPTFVNREIWEIATAKEDMVKDIFEKSGWKYITIADEPGLVSARIISMIINEAYFALGEAVSSKDEIDLAMKLGTNYPYGPFEWGKKIGLERVYNLLQKLSETDSRYNIAPAMKNELSNN